MRLPRRLVLQLTLVLLLAGPGCLRGPAKAPSLAQVRDFLAQHDPVTRHLELSILKVTPTSADGSEVRVDYRLRRPEPADEEALLPVSYPDMIARRADPKLLKEMDDLAESLLASWNGKPELSSFSRKDPTLVSLQKRFQELNPRAERPAGQRSSGPPLSMEAYQARLARGPEPETIFFEAQIKAGEHETLDQSVKAGEIAPGQWRFYPETVQPPARRMAWRQREDLGEKRPTVRADSTEAKAALEAHLRGWRDLMAANSARLAGLRAMTEKRLAGVTARTFEGSWDIRSVDGSGGSMDNARLEADGRGRLNVFHSGVDVSLQGTWTYEPTTHELRFSNVQVTGIGRDPRGIKLSLEGGGLAYTLVDAADGVLEMTYPLDPTALWSHSTK